MRALTYILTFAIGFSIAFLFFRPKVTESIEIRTETRVDTVYTKHVERIPFPDLSYLALEDSIDYYRDLYREELGNIKIVKENEPFSAPLRRFTGDEVSLYGTTRYNALVAGSLLDMTIINDFRIPHITNRIETQKIVTRSRDLRGLYAGAGINQNLGYKVGASYVDRDWQFNYDYEPKLGVHWIGVRRRVF